MTQTTETPKLYVLDTNVLLHDHEAIYKFEEHDVILPIVVLEEIDKFKKGSDSINFQAREFIRHLDELTENRLFKGGVPINDQGGKLFIEIANQHSELVKHAFSMEKADNRILAVADQMRKTHENRDVIIVSKDINLRMKAKALGLMAQDYRNDKIRDIQEMYTGIKLVENIDPALISRFYEEPFEIPIEDIPLEEEPVAHQYFIFRSGSYSALAHYNPQTFHFERVYKAQAYSIEPRNSEQTFALDALLRDEVKLVTITGKAGTGKTLLALAAALEQRSDYRQIFLARPVVPLGNRDIGYLPGDIRSKLDPYIQPLWDNLGVIRHRFANNSKETKRINDMIEKEKLFIAPLAFIRGRSLDNIYFIVDEAQNLTPHEVKTIITRAGEGAKMVFTGDIYQIDTPYLDTQSNGLAYLVHRMKGQPLTAHINLVKGERSELSELASNLL